MINNASTKRKSLQTKLFGVIDFDFCGVAHFGAHSGTRSVVRQGIFR